jgi:hypothetical protein
MNRIERFFSQHWQALPACLMAILFIYYYTLHSGIGISPDSVIYASTAENLKANFTAYDFNGTHLVDFPLGYPALLALLSAITKTSVLKVAPFLNAVLFCIAIFLTSTILNRYIKQSALYKLALLLLLACSRCLLEVYGMLWSETLFICWVLLFLLIAHTYLRTQTMRALVWMGICCSLAIITRYAGICLLLSGGLLVLLHGEATVKQKIKQALVFGITGAILPALNLARNLSVRDSFTGVREKALRSLWENLHGMAAVFGDWFPFLKNNSKIALLLVIVLLLAAAAAFIYHVLQQQYFTAIETAVLCFCLVYLCFMLFIASVSRFEELSSRLLAPAYIPVLLAGTHWIIPVIQNRLRKWQPWLVVAALGLYTTIILHQYQLNAEEWEGIKDAGMPGYTEDSWTQSPTIHFIKKQRVGFAYPAYANANDAVYFLTGIYTMPLPHKEIAKEVDQLMQKQTFYLIWLNDGANDDLLSLDYIRQHRKILETREFEDGAIYLFAAE